jgi:hypothetical protein
LDQLPVPSDELRQLFTTQSSDARQFREHIHQYNCALAFTSFTAKEMTDINNGGGPWVWKSSYMIYHQIGTLLPDGPRRPEFAQLYFYDPAEALNFRMQQNKNLNCDTMQNLQNMLRHTHQYMAVFLHSLDVTD